MNTFALLSVCFLACLVQSVWSQYNSFGQSFAGAATNPGLHGYGSANPGFANPGFGGVRYPNDLAPGLAGARPSAATPTAMYGGIGDGDVTVNGELPVVGTTVINGQVPVIGAVKFNGDLPAGGFVTITGTCACGCNAPLVY